MAHSILSVAKGQQVQIDSATKQVGQIPVAVFRSLQ
jgi:hypothetical protein